MKRKKLSNRTKGKIIIITSVSLVLFLLLLPFILRYDFDAFWYMFRAYIDKAIENQVHIMLLLLIGIPIALVLMRAIIDTIIPAVGFFFGKLFSYFIIWCLCRKNHYSCHINRAPFASLKGIDACADIEIQINEKKLFVHFIDIPFPVLRMFLLMNDREYRIHRSLPGKIQAGIGIRPGAREMDAKHFKPYSIPEFPQKGTAYHYLVIAPSYADAYFMNGQAMLSVTGECTSGNVTVCKLKVLKRRLNNTLYSPIK